MVSTKASSGRNVKLFFIISLKDKKKKPEKVQRNIKVDVNGVPRYGGILCTRLTVQKYDMKRDMDQFINANCK